MSLTSINSEFHQSIDDKILTAAIHKLYQWQYGQRDEGDFTIQLFTLLQKADKENAIKLTLAYPVEAKAYQLWYQASDQIEFFKAYGAWKGPRS